MTLAREGARRRLGLLAKAVLTLAVTYFLFRALGPSWHELRELRAAAWLPRPGLLAASLGSVLAGLLYVVWLWTRIIRSLQGPLLGFEAAVGVYFVSSLGRYLPGKVWQLAGLAYLASRQGVDPRLASLAAVLAQIFSLAAAVAVGGLYLLSGEGSAVPRDLAIGAVVLAIAVWVFATVPALLRFVVRRVMSHRSESVPPPRMSTAYGLRWLLLHVPAWLAYGLGFGLLWEAIPALPPVPWIAAIGAFAAAYVLGYAALFAPAGLGVREGVLAVLLAPWLGASTAAVLAVAARVWLTAAELLPLAGFGARRAVARLQRDAHAS